MHPLNEDTAALIAAVAQALKTRNERVEAEKSVTGLRMAESFAMFHLSIVFARLGGAETPPAVTAEPDGAANDI